MKINLIQKLYDDKLEILIEPHLVDGKTEEKELTFKEVLERAAIFTFKEMTPDKKNSDFDIFLKLKGVKNEVDLESEEISRLKEKCLQIFNIIIVGQVNNLLEGKENPMLLTGHPPKPSKPK